MKIIQSIKRFYQKHKEQVDYILVGGLATLVSLGSYFLCTAYFFNPQDPIQLQLANILSWICAVTFAFFVNRKYVFNSRGNIFSEAAKFVGARVFTLLIEIAFMASFVTLMGLNDRIAKLAVQIVVFILNYLCSKFFVFQKLA